jgi:hypothetical protein
MSNDKYVDKVRYVWVLACILAMAACGISDDSSNSPDTGSISADGTISVAAIGTDSRVRTMLDEHGRITYMRDCGDPSDGRAHCNVLVPSDSTGHVTPLVAPAGWGAVDLESAYGLSLSSGGARTVAIVLWDDDPNLESDLGVYRSQYGLPTCTTANGCFKKVNQSGATSPLPTTATGSTNTEWALDASMVSAACPFCNIVVVEANSNDDSDLMAAEDTAASLAYYVSNSWGQSEFSGETSLESHFDKPGVGIFAASGDSGGGHELYPAASEYVTAVGGTVLSTASGTSRGWSETVWSGAGAGCSPFISKPSWQHDASCATRMVADVSAVASGVAVFDSVSSGGWTTVAGTSIATPLTTGIYANTDNRGASPSLSYTTATFNDVTSGNDESGCTSYECMGVVGYDGPSGNGTPVPTNITRYDTLFGPVTTSAAADAVAINDTNVYTLFSNGAEFTSANEWLNAAFFGSQATLLGDVNGDGKKDLVAFGGTYVEVTLSAGTAFLPPANWLNEPFYGTHGTFVGDVNGDGKADGIAINNSSVYVTLSNSPSSLSFGTPQEWSSVSFYGTISNLAADVNGDGRTDLIAINQPNSYVMLSNGTSFNSPQEWSTESFYGTMATLAGDVNGDGKADVIAVNQNNVYVMLSSGSGFGTPQLWFDGDFYGTHTTSVGDFNGDGKADLVAVNDGNVYVMLSNGTSFTSPTLWFNAAFYGDH